MIKIEKIQWISIFAKEAEVTISNGMNTLICFSQPFKYEVGDIISETLYCYDVKNIMKSDEVELIAKNSYDTFAYFLRGKLIDSKAKLVMVGGFKISLDDYSIPGDLQNGDIIEFTVQRLDIY